MNVAAKAKAIEWLSPSAIKSILNCPKMHARKAFDLGDIGKIGGLRHRILELYLKSRVEGDAPISLADAAAQAAQEFKGQLGAAEIQKAIDQVSRTPEAGLPDPATILSIEGSGLPEELMQKASNHPDAQPMLHVVVRDQPGEKWGPAYGVRMKIDILSLLDGGETDDLKIVDFKGFRASYEPGDNDIQALVNFVGACAIAKALGLSPAKIKWVGLAIPSLKEDPHEFWVEALDSAIQTLDRVALMWSQTKNNPPESPGSHCGKCKLNGTDQCSAWKGATGELVVQGYRGSDLAKTASVEAWGDDFIVEFYEALKARLGQIESLIDLTKAELSKRSKTRVLGPPGFKYVTRSQGTSKIEWVAHKLLDLFEKWSIDPRPVLGVTGGKTMIEDMVKASTKDKLERKNRMELLAGCYEQGTANVLRKVALASTDVAGVDAKSGPALVMDGGHALGLDKEEADSKT